MGVVAAVGGVMCRWVCAGRHGVRWQHSSDDFSAWTVRGENGAGDIGPDCAYDAGADGVAPPPCCPPAVGAVAHGHLSSGQQLGH